MLLEDKGLRTKNLDKIDMLEKVGTLLMLPELFLATSQQVANFFEVKLATINSAILDNLEELTLNGMETRKGADFIDAYVKSQKNITWKKERANYKVYFNNEEELNIGGKGIRLFNKRAILNIGMLLRDSEVAKRLRAALLDVVEEAPKAVIKVTKNLLAEKEIYFLLDQYITDELTFKKTKHGIFENLKAVPFQKRIPIVNSLKTSISENMETMQKTEFAKAFDLLTLSNDLNEHLAERTSHSKFLMVTKRNKTITQLETKLKKAIWKPDFEINTNYSCFSKNAMYSIAVGKLVTSKSYLIWKKNFPYELIKSGLKKEFYTQPFEWCVSGSFFEQSDPSNVITPVQDQIAKALDRDDKEIFFKGFIHEEMSYVGTWKESKMKLYFRLLPQGDKDGSI